LYSAKSCICNLNLRAIKLNTYENHNIHDDVLIQARKDFEPLLLNHMSVPYLLHLLENEIKSERAVFSTHFSLYRAILYLYSISNISEIEKEKMHNHYMEEIKKKETGIKRLYNEYYNPLLSKIELFFTSPEIIQKEIEKSILKYKFDMLLKYDLIIA